tara:strand:+ start:1658 stop:1939 length:282 start_codon:yes stop_codon:yes gene_type:complete
MGKRIDLKNLKQYIIDKGFIIQNHCWKCQKVSYRTESDAKVIASEMRHVGKGHSYAYQCPKGNGWHLTSQKPKSTECPKQRKQSKSHRNKKSF